MYERRSSRLELCIQVLHLTNLHYAVWSKMHKVTLFLINQTLDCRPVYNHCIFQVKQALRISYIHDSIGLEV